MANPSVSHAKLERLDDGGMVSERDDYEELRLGKARRSDERPIRIPTGSTPSLGGGGQVHPLGGGGGFHCTVKTMSRTGGRSATAAIAYRAGERIEDERTGEVHDYSRKQGVGHAEIVLPEASPAWAADRAALWNAAEKAETRKNSVVAREWEVAIPYGLNKDQAVDLVREYAREIVKRHGIAVDFAIHQDNPKTWNGKKKDEKGFHAHILGTTRRLGPAGFTEKSRELDDKLKRGPEEVKHWRQRWAELGATRLRQLGREIAAERWKAGNLTIEEQRGAALARGDREWANRFKDRAPSVHLGPSATALERRGQKTEIGRHNRGIVSAIVLQAKVDLLRGEKELLQQKNALLPAAPPSLRAKMDLPQSERSLPRPERALPREKIEPPRKEIGLPPAENALPQNPLSLANAVQIEVMTAKVREEIGGEELRWAIESARRAKRALEDAQGRLTRHDYTVASKGLLARLAGGARDKEARRRLGEAVKAAAAVETKKREHLVALERRQAPLVDREVQRRLQGLGAQQHAKPERVQRSAREMLEERRAKERAKGKDRGMEM
jgi:hypothetical protein